MGNADFEFQTCPDKIGDADLNVRNVSEDTNRMELVQANEERRLIWEGRSGTLEEQRSEIRCQRSEDRGQ